MKETIGIIILFILIQIAVFFANFFTGIDEVRILLSFILLSIITLNFIVFYLGKKLIKNRNTNHESTIKEEVKI